MPWIATIAFSWDERRHERIRAGYPAKSPAPRQPEQGGARRTVLCPFPWATSRRPRARSFRSPMSRPRGMIQLVFEKFEELGSAYAVFRYLIMNDLKLGFRRHRAAASGSWSGSPPRPIRILSILRHPIYAGAYAYGLHRRGRVIRRPDVSRAANGSCRPRSWPCSSGIGSPPISPGIDISRIWRRLEQNRSLRDSRGVPRRGEALLPGLVVCGECGLRMATRYKSAKRPSYYCGEH